MTTTTSTTSKKKNLKLTTATKEDPVPKKTTRTKATPKTATKKVAAATESSSTESSSSATPSSTTSATTPASNTGLMSLVTELSSFLDTAEDRLGPEPVITTTTQKRRTSKPRKGADKVLGLIAPIVQQHGLESTSLNTTAMLGANDTAQTLLPLQTRLQKIAKRVGNEVFDAQTTAWSMGLQFYALLKRRAKNDGELAQNIAPLAKVFSYRHPLIKATKPTKVQTRAKAMLKDATALAKRHDVGTVESAPMPATAAPVPAATPSAPAVVAPAPQVAAAQLAPSTVASAPAPAAAVAPPAAPSAAAPAVATNGAAGTSSTGH